MNGKKLVETMKVSLFFLVVTITLDWSDTIPVIKPGQVNWNEVRNVVDDISFNVVYGFGLVITLATDESPAVGKMIEDKLYGTGWAHVQSILRATYEGVKNENLTTSQAEPHVLEVRKTVDESLVGIEPEIELLLTKTRFEIAAIFGNIQHKVKNRASVLYMLLNV